MNKKLQWKMANPSLFDLYAESKFLDKNEKSPRVRNDDDLRRISQSSNKI
jgi:hypothetical protein